MNRVRGFAVAIGVLLVGGCMLGVPRAEDASLVDFERLEQLRTDPWLAADGADVARYQFGSDGMYNPGRATATHRLSAPGADAVRAELAAAAQVGWWPYYGRCPTDSASRWEFDDLLDPRFFVVFLARELPDGALAEAEVAFIGWFRHESDPVRLTADVKAGVPNHAHPAVARPAVVDIDSLECMGGTGPTLLGEADHIAWQGR